MSHLIRFASVESQQTLERKCLSKKVLFWTFPVTEYSVALKVLDTERNQVYESSPLKVVTSTPIWFRLIPDFNNPYLKKYKNTISMFYRHILEGGVHHDMDHLKSGTLGRDSISEFINTLFHRMLINQPVLFEDLASSKIREKIMLNLLSRPGEFNSTPSSLVLTLNHFMKQKKLQSIIREELDKQFSQHPALLTRLNDFYKSLSYTVADFMSKDNPGKLSWVEPDEIVHKKISTVNNILARSSRELTSIKDARKTGKRFPKDFYELNSSAVAHKDPIDIPNRYSPFFPELLYSLLLGQYKSKILNLTADHHNSADRKTWQLKVDYA